jgi:Putative glycolipid-binding
VLEADGADHWLVDGETAPQLDGCLDVDLESSAMTNALPVRRLGLAVAAQAATPAAYVRAVGLAVDRLEQTYLRTPGEGTHQCYDYTAPAFDFECRLAHDQSGLVLDYPGIADAAGSPSASQRQAACPVVAMSSENRMSGVPRAAYSRCQGAPRIATASPAILLVEHCADIAQLRTELLI